MVIANGYFSRALSSIMKKTGDLLKHFGIISAAAHVASKYAIGFAKIHPGYFVSALLSSIII